MIRIEVLLLTAVFSGIISSDCILNAIKYLNETESILLKQISHQIIQIHKSSTMQVLEKLSEKLSMLDQKVTAANFVTTQHFDKLFEKLSNLVTNSRFCKQFDKSSNVDRKTTGSHGTCSVKQVLEKQIQKL